ncbi:MAG: RNA polymerase sigma factor [Planctomycetes bacterium]|nr:RNA polymerase sigma factor [Planctomycetota bacterium]
MAKFRQDKSLFLRLKEKDKEAFIKAYDLYLDDIYRFIFFKVGVHEEAEDLTAAVFLKTWNYIQNNDIAAYSSLKSFLYKVARNLVIDHYRKKSLEKSALLSDDPAGLDLPDENQDIHRQIELHDDYGFIESKLFELKDEYREVITLRYINELSVSEIAKTLDKSRGNIRVLIYRAIKALKGLANENKNSEEKKYN